MNAQPKLTSADIQRGQQAALQELEDARAAHAKCAYAHAIDRDDEAARQALIQSKQRLDLLEAELQGLNAATGEAQRRERLVSLEAQVAEWKQTEAAGYAAVDEAEKAFAKVERAVTALGKAYKELEIAERHARQLEARCARAGGDYGYYTSSIVGAGQIEKLLQHATGPCRYDTYEAEVLGRPAAAVERGCERSRSQIRAGVAAKVEALQQEAAKLA